MKQGILKQFNRIAKIVAFAVAFITAFSFSLALYAQASGAVPALPAIDQGQEFIDFLVMSLGGLKGASTLAVIGIVVKLLLKTLDQPFAEKFLGTKFSDWTGGLKLTVVLILSMVSGVVGLMSPPLNLSLSAALIHSATLSAFLVLINQIYKQFIEKKKA